MRARSIIAPLALVASTVTCGGEVAPSEPLDPGGAPSEPPGARAPSEPERVPRIEGSSTAGPRSRWLAYTTWVSSASTQTLLHLIDLNHPERSPIEVERESALSVTYSPDGRWLSYQSWRGPNETRLYLIDISGDQPKTPVLLLQSVRGRPCAWSPDSTKLACIKQVDPAPDQSPAVVAFDTSRASPGEEVPVGSFASHAHWLDGLFWPDSSTLVFPGEGSLTRVAWTGAMPGEPTPFAAPGGAMVRLSPDGRRALVTGIRDYDPAILGDQNPSFRIVDLETGTSIAIDSHRSWSFAESLDAAVAIEPASRHYVRIGATEAVTVASVATDGTATPWSREWQRPLYRELWLGSRAIELRAGRPVVVTIGDSGIADEAVPGPFSNVQHVRPSPDGTLLYIGSALLDDKNRPIDASATHWLSRMVDGHPQPAAPFASGYATGGLASISFSPSSRKLLLHGDHGYYQAPTAPVAVRLYDLSGVAVQERSLDVSLRWASSAWARDSSFLSILGADTERTSFVVDVASDQTPLRRLFTCNSNPATLPGCPGGATF